MYAPARCTRPVMSPDPIGSINVQDDLGECVLWDDRTQSLWWTDIEKRLLHRLDWASRAMRDIPTPERLCAFGFTENGTNLIAAFESGFAFFDPDTGAVDWLVRPALPGQRLNDGRVDREGRFWAGSMAEEPEQKGKAQLFCLDSDGSLTARERGLTISNGIGWSPDGTRFYLADSTARTIWRYDFDPGDGAISARRIFAQTQAGAMPDGAAIDAEGHLWSAQWGAGRVVRYSPHGIVDRVLDVPASQPTCVAFGGPERSLLFVTSARIGLSKSELGRQSGAGDVFVYNAGVTGLPEPRFRWNGPAFRGQGGR